MRLSREGGVVAVGSENVNFLGLGWSFGRHFEA